MDTIVIQELEVAFRVGVPDEERAQPQRLHISLEMNLDLTMALEKDDVRWTIDYAAVCRRLNRMGEGRSWRLIESLAAEIATLILRDFGAVNVTVEVRKFVLAETRYVAVRLTRTNQEDAGTTRFLAWAP